MSFANRLTSATTPGSSSTISRTGGTSSGVVVRGRSVTSGGSRTQCSGLENSPLSVSRLLCGGRDAEFIERLLQLHSNRVCVAVFDVAPLQHVDQGAVLKQRDRRRRGLIASEVAARAIRRVDVRAGKHRGDAIRFVAVAQRERNARAGLARRASTHRV